MTNEERIIELECRNFALVKLWTDRPKNAADMAAAYQALIDDMKARGVGEGDCP